MLGPGAGFDPIDALRSWDIGPASVARSTWGLNNESWFVDAAAGRFVLRLYGTARERDLADEHALLAALALAGLPFATPRPLAPRGSSVTWARVSTLAGPRLVALFERIPGTHLDDADSDGLGAAAWAFAKLDVALAVMTTAREPFSGRLETVHPKVGDLEALAELGDDGAAFIRRMRVASQQRGVLRPRQVVHGDFAFGNVLLEAGRVSGILDFEVAAEDARVAELAVALRLVLSKRDRDRLWRPLLSGYLRACPLTPPEIASLPVLAMHHDAVVLVWWLGRLRDGIRDARPLRDRVREAIDRERWLTENARLIVDAAIRVGATE
jgi:homoserine kinase type II